MIQRFATSSGNFWAQMLTDHAWFKAASAAMGGWLAYILPTEAVRASCGACAILIAIDTITGIAASIRSGHPLSSAKFSRVLSKLIAYGSVVAVVSICGRYLPGLADFRVPAITAALYLILATEGISVLENASKLDVKLPKGLVKWLKGKLQEEAEFSEEKP